MSATKHGFIRNVLMNVREYLTPERWARGSWFEGADGQRVTLDHTQCLANTIRWIESGTAGKVGSFSGGFSGASQKAQTERYLEEILRQDYGVGEIPEFNDGTSYDDVMSLVDKALKLVEAEEREERRKEAVERAKAMPRQNGKFAPKSVTIASDVMTDEEFKEMNKACALAQQEIDEEHWQLYLDGLVGRGFKTYALPRR